MLNLKQIDKSWTLFLDRDGVINHEKEQDYIYHYGEFVFYDGAREALKIFSGTFSLIIIATNQRGIGKGLMTEKNLQAIHENMVCDIKKAGGRVDKIYYNISLDNDHPLRKPQPGMALLAKKDFPQIDFSRSIMVGNNLSDMLFGKNAGMHTVFLKTTSPEQELPHEAIDLSFNSLIDFAKALQEP
ncbi:MAG: HAD-IIIA family hydrolase [Bacteroidetes bacterium]|nr:HAD-IIIA family hydrolase [Bacteroidota bacterium]